MKPIISALCLCVCFSGFRLMAQNSSEATWQLRHKVANDTVYLRWSFPSVEVWNEARKKGLTLERVTLERDGVSLAVPEILILEEYLQPQELGWWKPLVQNRPMTAIMAQALYGKTFQTVQEGAPNGVISWLHEGKEQETRYGFAMFAADRDFVAAEGAALGYTDTAINQEERYVYRLRFSDSDTTYGNMVFVNPQQVSDAVVPPAPEGVVYNNRFLLVWDPSALEHFIGAYDLERSSDGIHFDKINAQPITLLNDHETKILTWSDSIPTYESPFWYRLVGRDYFGGKTAPSPAIQLVAYEPLSDAPDDFAVKSTTGSQAELTWNYSMKEAQRALGFILLYAATPTSPFKPQGNILPITYRKTQFTSEAGVAYLKLGVLGKAGDTLFTPTLQWQPIDSIPPAAPLGFAAVVASGNHISLGWEPNPESDLKGYRVQRTTREGAALTDIHTELLTTTMFTDTLPADPFATWLFYEVRALDHRYNTSIPARIRLRNPWKVPPPTPLIIGYDIASDSTSIRWEVAPYEEPISTVLFVKRPDGSWERMEEKAPGDLSAFSIMSTSGNTYHLRSVADRTRMSAPSPEVVLGRTPVHRKKEVKLYTGTVNRERGWLEVYWRIPFRDISEIRLYKAKKGEKLRLYQTPSVSATNITDTDLSPNTHYIYALQVWYEDGTISDFVPVEVTY